MTRPALLLLALTLAACGAEPGDEGSAGTDTSTGTTDPGTTSTTDPGTSAGPATTEAPTTGEPTTSGSTTGVDEARCDDYCTAILTNCTAPQAQYPSHDSCMNACASFPAGAPGDVSGNSYECRRYHTDAAAEDAPTHCVHAGPAGGGACGDNCDGFCTIAAAVCPTEHPSLDACLTTCMGFDDDEKFDIGDVAGDTLACRLYHLAVAATGEADAAVHCPHTLPDSPPCI